jgi:hypothetical protein
MSKKHHAAPPAAPPAAPSTPPPAAPPPHTEVAKDARPVCEIMLVIGRAQDGRFRVAIVEKSYGVADKPVTTHTLGWGSMRVALAEISRSLPKLQDFLRRRLPAAGEREVTRG